MGLHKLTAFAVLLLVAGVAQGSTINRFPPLFQDGFTALENPNARSGEGRADDLDYRLPNNTIPISYDVTLTTNVHVGDLNFKGIVVITLKAVEAQTKSIVLHALQLENISATLVDTTTLVSYELSDSYELEREFLTLTLKGDAVLVQDRTYKLTITYDGKLRTDNGGFYLSTYTNSEGRTVNLATTQFESTDARHGFPCYDEPAKRATFTITINHDPSYTAISNMPVDTAKSAVGKTAFLETPIMPTYLVAFIVSDFEYTSGSLNGLTQRIFSRPGTQNDREFALFSGIQLTARLGDYYKIPYMLPKLDQVAVPDFSAGAMENWGLATYREEYLLYNPEKSTTNTQTNIATIVAHEYAHMWFGDLVTIQWWTYLWLKEGFATMFEYKAVDEVYPEWGVMQLFQVSEFQSALSYDGGANPVPMTHYVQTPREISSRYNTVSYAKAGTVLLMWQHALTDEIFQAGLHKYLKLNEYTGANEIQLFTAIDMAASEAGYKLPDTAEVMLGSWSRKGGVPLLTVERNYEKKTFTVTQKSFYNDPKLSDNGLWYVPLNYYSRNNSDFRDTSVQYYLKNEAKIEIEDKNLSADEWLILNKQSTSYFRVQYDEQNWHLIIQGLLTRPQKIHPNNRAALLNDAYRLSVSERLKHGILMHLMTYLENEDQYAPWSTANSIINTFNRYLSGDKEYETFKAFVADLVNNIYEKLGANDITGEQHFTKNIRNVAINLACLAGIDSCLKETNNKLKALVSDGTEIEPNLQSIVYCNGLKQTGDKEFNYVYDRLMTSTNQAERRILISSLGCAQDPKQINKFIESSISNSPEITLRVQERTTLLSSAYQRGETGLLSCIDFLSENHEEYAALTSGFGGTNPLEADLVGMSNYVVNENQEAKLLELVAKVKKSHPNLSDNLETRVNSNIKANFDWLDANRDPIMNWVLDYKSSAGRTAITSILPTVFAAVYVILRFL